jgi:hypothetical protein
LVLPCEILLIIPGAENTSSISTVNGEAEELGSYFYRFAMAKMLVTIALLKNRTLVTKIRQAVLEVVRKQIRELLGSDSDQESHDLVSAHLQNMNMDDDDGSEDGGEGSDIDEEEEDEEEEEEEDESCRLPGFKLHSHDVFDYLWQKLPSGYQSYKIKIDFDQGYLYIRTVPGVIHSKAATAFQDTITLWARNAGTVPVTALSPLENFSDTSMVPLENHS